MISGQDYDKQVKITVSPECVTMVFLSNDGSYWETPANFRGEGAIKIGHLLIAAGEEFLKKTGEWKNS